MDKSRFAKIVMVTQEILDHIGSFNDGITLSEFKKHFKDLASRHGLENAAYVVYDQLAIDILLTTGAIILVTEPGEPTRLLAAHGEE